MLSRDIKVGDEVKISTGPATVLEITEDGVMLQPEGKNANKVYLRWKSDQLNSPI